jgi:hypothetical protein
MEIDNSEISPAIGVILIMILMLGISFINDYTHVALFCSGIVLGLSLFILYRGYKEYKRSRNAKK